MIKLKHFAYLRRSQDREDQQVLSIESQKRELIAYAKRHDIEIVEIISEDQTAYKRGRPKFNRMMERIEKGEANAVLTWHLTRLARNGADGGLIITFIDEGKILELRTTESVYLNKPDDKFMMCMHFAMAKKSSDDTSSFVKNNLKTKLDKGEYPGLVPYGYLNIDGNNVIAGKRFNREKQGMLEKLERPLGRIELDPIEAPLIRRVMEFALTGAYSTSALCEEAAKLGLTGKRFGKRVAKQALTNVLTNIFYTGKFEYQGQIWQGKYEPLITENEYQKLQTVLHGKSRPKKAGHDYTFSTLVYCPECNNRMSGEYQKGTHYYRCTRAKGATASCANIKHIRQDVLDNEIEATLLRIMVPPRIIDWALKYIKLAYLEENKVLTGKRGLFQKNINDEKQKLERLTAKWLSDGNTQSELMSDEDFKEQKVSIQSIIADNEAKLKENNGEEDTWLTKCEAFFIKMRTVAKEYNTATVIEKKILLQSMGAKFIRKDGSMTVQLEKPFSMILQSIPVEVLAEPALYRTLKTTIGDYDSEIDIWGGRWGSNPQPLGPQPSAPPLSYDHHETLI